MKFDLMREGTTYRGTGPDRKILEIASEHALKGSGNRHWLHVRFIRVPVGTTSIIAFATFQRWAKSIIE